MQERDITPLRQELRNRLFQGELGELAVPVTYAGKASGGEITVEAKEVSPILSGRGTALSDAMIKFADTKLDMALNIGHQRDNLLRANAAMQTMRDTAGTAKTSRIVIQTDALVRDILSSHGIAMPQRR